MTLHEVEAKVEHHGCMYFALCKVKLKDDESVWQCQIQDLKKSCDGVHIHCAEKIEWSDPNLLAKLKSSAFMIARAQVHQDERAFEITHF